MPIYTASTVVAMETVGVGVSTTPDQQHVRRKSLSGGSSKQLQELERAQKFRERAKSISVHVSEKVRPDFRSSDKYKSKSKDQELLVHIYKSVGDNPEFADLERRKSLLDPHDNEQGGIIELGADNQLEVAPFSKLNEIARSHSTGINKENNYINVNDRASSILEEDHKQLADTVCTDV